MEGFMILIIAILAGQLLALLAIFTVISRVDVRMIITYRERWKPESPPLAEPCEEEFQYDPDWWKKDRPPPG